MARVTHLAGAALLTVSSVVLAHDVVIDTGTRYQTMEGWGTSGVSSDPAWRTAYRDLGLNIIRMPMPKEVLADPSGDLRVPVNLGTDLQADIAKFNFGISSVSSYGSFAQWMQTNALEPDRVKLVGDVWSPPHWMKGPTGASQSWVGNWGNSLGQTAYPTPWLSNEHNGWGGFSHSGDSIGGRLKTEDPATLQQYGLYMASWMKGFQQQYGVPIYATSLQNESTFENPFDSMNYMVDQNGNTDFTQYAKGLKAVRDAWKTYGITTKVMGPHVAGIGGSPDNPWELWQQQSMIDGVRNDSDPTLKNFLSFYNSNYYMGSDANAVKMTAGYYHGASQVPANWASWFQPRGVQADGKGIWYSETGDGGNNWLDQSGNPGAIKMALKIHNALVYSDASAYVYWQFTDGSSTDQYSLLGTNDLANPTSSKKYAAFKQFSRYIRPGAQRVGAIFENGGTSVGAADPFDAADSLNVSAFLDEQDKLFTIVLINLLGSTQPVDVHLPPGLQIASLHAYETSGSLNFAQLSDVTAVDGIAHLDMGANTIITLTTTVPEPTTLLLVPIAFFGLLRRHRDE